MNEYLNLWIDNYNIPLLTAFLIGVMTSISPCPLATNITAIAYISKNLKGVKTSVVHGGLYALGRAASYTLIASLIFYGFSSFQISKLFQGWGDKVLGIILVLIGLVMMDIIKINIGSRLPGVEKTKLYLAQKGYIGTFLLGSIFALAFCPYSGVLFFGALIPLVLKSGSGLILPSIFALGTSIPVLFFVILLAFGTSKLSNYFSNIGKVEKYLRYCIASVFIIVGIYYCSITVKWLILIF